MGNRIAKLKSEGYDPVYIWNAEPSEEDLDHNHPFDTHLVILEGEIEIKMDGVSRILKANDELDIPGTKVHYGKAGSSGCKYIVAERHYPDGIGNGSVNMKNNTLNIYSKSDDWRGRVLSNFSHHPFVFEDQQFESVEGFLQGIAFLEGDARRQAAFQSWGSAAKKFTEEQEKKFVWWGGKEIIFGSPEEHALIERAIRAKFDQNPEAKKALIASKGLVFTHILPDPESSTTCLPAKDFCAILTKIRKEINHE